LCALGPGDEIGLDLMTEVGAKVDAGDHQLFTSVAHARGAPGVELTTERQVDLRRVKEFFPVAGDGTVDRINLFRRTLGGYGNRRVFEADALEHIFGAPWIVGTGTGFVYVSANVHARTPEESVREGCKALTLFASASSGACLAHAGAGSGWSCRPAVTALKRSDWMSVAGKTLDKNSAVPPGPFVASSLAGGLSPGIQKVEKEMNVEGDVVFRFFLEGVISFVADGAAKALMERGDPLQRPEFAASRPGKPPKYRPYIEAAYPQSAGVSDERSALLLLAAAFSAVAEDADFALAALG
jgi:hypothetical protein